MIDTFNALVLTLLLNRNHWCATGGLGGCAPALCVQMSGAFSLYDCNACKF
jgi:hypothetical protein